MKKIMLLFCFVFSLQAIATIKIAVIDTGFDFESNWEQKDLKKLGLYKPKLCDSSLHRDFVGNGIQDTHGHGTHVAGLIARELGNMDYCLIIIKGMVTSSNIKKSVMKINSESFRYAVEAGAKIINYSGGGVGFNLEEYLSVKFVLDNGVTLVTSAGNNSKKIDTVVDSVTLTYVYGSEDSAFYRINKVYLNKSTNKTTLRSVVNYYPANYDSKIIAVKNLTIKNGKKVLHSTSNRGKAFEHEEIGTGVVSLGLNNNFEKMTGTSQAAPVKTGKIVKEWIKNGGI